MARASSSGWSSVLAGGTDTIVARATPEGRGALAVIRCSGREAFPIAAVLCRGFDPKQRWRAQRVDVLGPSGAVLDDALAIAFPGPRSATGEDVVELTCHGSPYLARAVVDAFVALGARPAEPGEFSRRAVANGKLDLLQAEGLRDLIEAETAAAARAARGQLEGRLSARLGELRHGLVELLARLEGALDLVGQGIDLDRAEVEERAAGCRDCIARLMATAAAGDRLRRGARVVLLGPPNAGKSTLFNRLVGWERAIVAPTPGTTRDAVEARLEVSGHAVTLVDTAGEGEPGDELELAGMGHARREAAEADVLLRLWPADMGPPPQQTRAAGQSAVLVLSKSDLATATGATEEGWIPVSAVLGTGVEEVRRAVGERLSAGIDPADEDRVTVSARHQAALRRAGGAVATLPLEHPEIAAECVREALDAVRELTGEVTTDDLLDAVFRTFCVGK